MKIGAIMVWMRDRIGQWRKSSYSGDHRDCVEVANDGDDVLIRDTKNQEGGHLAVGQGSWAAMMIRIRHGAE